MFKRSLIILSIMSSFTAIAAEDSRIHVDFSPMMQEHMMGNMRDHLLALQTITRQLSAEEFEAAADTAEQRLGLSSLDDHGAKHLGQMMPPKMAEIGTGMHHAASRFAVVAKDAEVSNEPAKVYGALSDIMQQCVACHAAYKIH